MYAVLQNVVDPQTDPSVEVTNNEKEDTLSNAMTPSATSAFVDKDTVLENSVYHEDEDPEEEDLQLRISSPFPETSHNNNKRHRHHEHYYYGSTHRKYSTLPHSRRHPKTKSESCSKSSNPLLDTISVLTYDPCDSDDYYDLTSAYEQRRVNPKHDDKSSTTSGHTGLVDGDRDSIGYAGSSSIDSGYKSFCPTPEIPDTSLYGADRAQSSTSCSSIYTDSSLCSTSSHGRSKDGGKTKITMGTKVTSRQVGHTTGMFRDHPSTGASSSRRSDTCLYDVNLDHLMYLRQSLLSAIQQCESSRGFSQTSHCDEARSVTGCKSFLTDNHMSHAQCSEGSCSTSTAGSIATRDSDPSFRESSVLPSQTSSSTTSCSSPTCHKTVRFDTDVKVSPVTSGKTLKSTNGGVERTNSSVAWSDRNHGQRSARNTQGVTKSKSILKDPLCANLRSQLEAGAPPDCKLEEEIDSLLYGRAEFYDLESVDEFPCSYVTMIEEKYRSGKPSVAKVRKLKGGKVVECSKRQPSVETSSSFVAESEVESATAESGTRPVTSSTKCRFTEVARCMLEIIEDLQLKKLHLESAGKNAEKPPCLPQSVTASDRLHPSTCSSLEHRTEAIAITNTDDYSMSCGDDSCVSEDLAKKLKNKNLTPSNSCYTSASEYHVYEEISYDFVGGRLQKTLPTEVPPPLPARPSTLFQKLDHPQAPFSPSFPSSSSSPPQPVCRKDRCVKKTHTSAVEDGSVRDRPKQRSNLYSLFSDQAERRNISRSLERESRKTSYDNSEGQEDDYGFKRSFPSI